MEITRESDYAIRCVLYLSGKPGDIVMVDEIAREMEIPKSFLAKILQKLNKSGLVKSYRGIKGGFQLARSPREVTLLDVVEAVEGPVALNSCVIDKSVCGRSSTCGVHHVWADVRADFREILKKYTFERLAPASASLRQQ
ncbi:MAG: Rrf2 family transcriptional regulator [Nitrospirota bacterium]